MVVAEDPGELDGELVVVAKRTAARLVAPDHGVGAGADDELVAGIVAVAAQHRGLHGGEDLAAEGTRSGAADGLGQRVVGEAAGAAHVVDLPRALHRAQPIDQVGRVGEGTEPVEGGRQPPAVPGREPVRLPLDAEPGAAAAVLFQDRPQVGPRRVGVGQVHPDSDVLDHRGDARLAQVGRARQERHRPVGVEVEALEEAEAEGVVAGQVVHALLAEEEEPVEPAPGHRVDGAPPAFGQLVRREVKGHLRKVPLPDPPPQARRITVA